MPWSQTSPMDQKTQFIADYLREILSVSELCELYGISRKTAYKWIDRYLRQGPTGLEDRSRRPHTSANHTPSEIERALLEVRRRHPSWGAKKLLTLVHKGHPRWELPHRSTVCEILSRNGMVPKTPRRRHIGHPGKPATAILAPNDLWSADFKGQFKMGNGRYCFPLTVTDNFSRYLLSCQALSSTAVDEAKPIFTRLFKEYGLPRRIRTDNGVPFATTTLARLSRLSACGYASVSCQNLSSPVSHNRTVATSACISRSKPKRRDRLAIASHRSSANSMRSSMSSTTCGHTKRSIRRRRPLITNDQRARCRTRSSRLCIQIASRCATSVPMAGSAGTATG